MVFEFSHREYRPFVRGFSGQQDVLPVVITEQGVLDQFAHYMYLRRNKSRSWQDAATFAVQLLLEFMEKNQSFFDKPSALFEAFSNALHTGTVEGRFDPSGLYWQARQYDDANQLINHITQFTDWLSKYNDDASLQLNPWQEATRHEQRLNWAAYTHRRDNAFLSHLWSYEHQTNQSRNIRSRVMPVERQAAVNAFPEEYFERLMSEGFHRRARDTLGQVDLRNILITYLMHFGGLRLSEALSLWSTDVNVEGGEVIVRVYHPEEGLAPSGKAKRSTYLQNQFGLQPRNKIVKATDSLFLGWKNCLITDKARSCFEVFFYPYETGQVFARMWRDYHLKQRVKPKAGEEHPYAFTNKHGQPYSHRMFRKAHKLGVERIGLVYEKIEGTTPHGHRHAYGQRLARDGADPLLIKNAMHHALITSSQTYTKPTTTQMRQDLCDLEARLRSQHAEDSHVLLIKD